MRPLVAGLLLSLVFAPALQAQQAEQLRIAVVVENPGSEAEFTARQLQDAVTVLLTAKAPDVGIDNQARVWLYIAPTCLPVGRGWSCFLLASMRFTSFGWSNPFRELPPTVTMWEAGTLLTGPPGSSLRQAREALDEILDQPVAAWRRLSGTQRECWTRFLNTPWWREAAWEGVGDSPQLGPCG